MVGMAATQLPNNKLDTANKNATANTGFKAIKERKFLNNTRKNTSWLLKCKNRK